ncbi:MAG TPA: hypothetical protein DCG32_03255 [Sphaerochaeta sp.]|nr:hypothetical protein [Sphaerochaeta sp.]
MPGYISESGYAISFKDTRRVLPVCVVKKAFPGAALDERKHLPPLLVGRCFLWIVGLEQNLEVLLSSV